MKMNKFYLRAVIMAGILLIAVAANAILTVKFTTTLNPNQMQYFWSGDPSAANNTGRAMNTTDANINFVLPYADPASPPSGGVYAHPQGTTPSDTYVFGSDNGAPNSATTNIRVWNGQYNNKGGQYTGLGSYANDPKGTGSNPTFSVSYAYEYNDPLTPVFYQVDQTTSKPLPNGTTTGKLIIYSEQSSPSTGHLPVEIAACQWQATYFAAGQGAGQTLTTGATGANIEFDTPTYTLNPNDVYKVKVRYQNRWGDWGSWSAEFSQTIGAISGGAAVTVSQVTYPLKSTGLGLNTMAFAFDTSKGSIEAADGTVVAAQGQSLTISALINEINRQAGSSIVRTVGYYDNVAQKQVGLTSVTGSTAIGDTAANVLAHVISGEAQSYQVSVSTDLNLVLKGYK